MKTPFSRIPAPSFVKSYGRVDSSWDMARFRGILEDASAMAGERSVSLCIGEDADENVVIVPNQRGAPIHILACGITKEGGGEAEAKEEPRKEFWDNAEYRKYTIDEMVPRVYDCLVNGAIEYGSLGFLSEGRIQLARVLEDAGKLVKKHGRPFVAGLGKENGIMVAPMSERSEFVAPLSCVIAKSGFWSVSDMHSDRILPPHSYIVTTTEADALARLDNTGPLSMLYEGIAYGRKRYGRFEVGRDRSVLDLESAFEDAAGMPRHRDGVPYCVILGRDGFIYVQSKAGYTQSRESDALFWEDRRGDAFLEVDPGQFLDGGMPLRERISAAAKDAYGKFSQIRRNA